MKQWKNLMEVDLIRGKWMKTTVIIGPGGFSRKISLLIIELNLEKVKFSNQHNE